jgi:hypothetical protein
MSCESKKLEELGLLAHQGNEMFWKAGHGAFFHNCLGLNRLRQFLFPKWLEDWREDQGCVVGMETNRRNLNGY